MAGEAGEEKESGGGDGKKEEAKNEGGGEGKKEGEGGEEKKGGEKEEEQNPEILLRVDMHCEGCARKVRRSLRGFPGPFPPPFPFRWLTSMSSLFEQLFHIRISICTLTSTLQSDFCCYRSQSLFWSMNQSYQSVFS